MRPFWPSCHVFDTLVLHNSLVFAVLYCLCLCKIKKISFLITDKVFDHRAQPLDACFKHFLTADLTSHFTCQVCNSREKSEILQKDNNNTSPDFVFSFSGCFFTNFSRVYVAQLIGQTVTEEGNVTEIKQTEKEDKVEQWCSRTDAR